MKSLINIAIGFAAGYTLSRVLESRSHGIPWQSVFTMDPILLLTPVNTLAQAAAAVAQQQADAPMEPSRKW
jgi:hypothetical protein